MPTIQDQLVQLIARSPAGLNEDPREMPGVVIRAAKEVFRLYRAAAGYSLNQEEIAVLRQRLEYAGRRVGAVLHTLDHGGFSRARLSHATADQRLLEEIAGELGVTPQHLQV